MKNNYQENGIFMSVHSDAENIGSSIRAFVNKYAANVQVLPHSDPFGPTAYADTKAAWIISGQVGIAAGFRYPLHGRYTSWGIQVVILDGSGEGQSEVILNALGAPNPINSLSMRCSMDYRKKLEDTLRKRFKCGPVKQIEYEE